MVRLLAQAPNANTNPTFASNSAAALDSARRLRSDSRAAQAYRKDIISILRCMRVMVFAPNFLRLSVRWDYPGRSQSVPARSTPWRLSS